MVNYQDAKIYKIVDNTNDNVYIGSTCKKLSQRITQNRSDYKKYLNGKTTVTTSYKILENGNYDIVLIEKCPCQDKEELHRKERFYIESMKCINKTIPSRSKEESSKEYRKINSNKIKEHKNKVCICQICNCEYTHAHLKRHERTKKHQDNLLATKQ